MTFRDQASPPPTMHACMEGGGREACSGCDEAPREKPDEPRTSFGLTAVRSYYTAVLYRTVVPTLSATSRTIRPPCVCCTDRSRGLSKAGGGTRSCSVGERSANILDHLALLFTPGKHPFISSSVAHEKLLRRHARRCSRLGTKHNQAQFQATTKACPAMAELAFVRGNVSRATFLTWWLLLGRSGRAMTTDERKDCAKKARKRRVLRRMSRRPGIEAHTVSSTKVSKWCQLRDAHCPAGRNSLDSTTDRDVT